MTALSSWLRLGTRVALGLAVLTVALRGTVEQVVGWAMVAVLVGVPLARVGWLGWRWRRTDPPFAWMAAGLLVVVVVGAVLARLLR